MERLLAKSLVVKSDGGYTLPRLSAEEIADLYAPAPISAPVLWVSPLFVAPLVANRASIAELPKGELKRRQGEAMKAVKEERRRLAVISIRQNAAKRRQGAVSGMEPGLG